MFKTQLATTAHTREEEPKTVLPLPTEDGDAVFILCHILHLRNDKLPARISADLLLKISLLAETYGCTVAVGRSTTQWFDHLYHLNNAGHEDLCKIVEAAYILDEAVWFARFTTRWVLNCSISMPRLPDMSTNETQKLALMLLSQQTSASIRLRMDFDSLADIAVRYFSREFKHYIDWAPEMSPDPSETPSGKEPVRCRVDGDGGQEFLGALREAQIWPSEVWFRDIDNVSMREEDASRVSIGDIVDRLAEFLPPDYDDADRCEFCDGIKEAVVAGLKRVKQEQKERLWGLCLDCFRANGVNAGECRFDHARRQEQQQKTVRPPLQIQDQTQTGAARPGGGIVQQANGTQQVQQERGGLGIEGL